MNFQPVKAIENKLSQPKKTKDIKPLNLYDIITRISGWKKDIRFKLRQCQ